MSEGITRLFFPACLSCAFGPTPEAPRAGTITRIGRGGCFVKTKAMVTRGQTVFIRVWTPENRWLPLRGRIHYHLERAGFGVTFDEDEGDEADGLEKLIEWLRAGEGAQPRRS